jgi:hypothetical protein
MLISLFFGGLLWAAGAEDLPRGEVKRGDETDISATLKRIETALREIESELDRIREDQSRLRREVAEAVRRTGEPVRAAEGVRAGREEPKAEAPRERRPEGDLPRERRGEGDLPRERRPEPDPPRERRGEGDLPRERRPEGEGAKFREGAEVPIGARGFRGELSGTVLSVLERGFILKVEKVEKVWEENKADRPEALVGARVVAVIGQASRLADRQMQTVRDLKAGDRVTVEVFHFGGDAMTIVENLKKLE